MCFKLSQLILLFAFIGTVSGCKSTMEAGDGITDQESVSEDTNRPDSETPNEENEDETEAEEDTEEPEPQPTPESTPTPTPTPMPTPASCDLSLINVAATSDDGNRPANMLDKNLATRWSALGLGESATFDLRRKVDLKGLKLAFYMGDKRNWVFHIAVSSNGDSFQKIFEGVSSGNSSTLESFPVQANGIRYVRYIGFGNQQSSEWNSVTEIEFEATNCGPLQNAGDIPMPTPAPTPTPSPTPKPTPTPTPSPTPVVSTGGLGPQPIRGDGRDGDWYVAPNGNDSNSGSMASPFKTMERAGKVAKPGDLIYMRGGRYPGARIYRIQGTEKNPITFRAFPGETPILDAKLGFREDIILWVSEDVAHIVFDGIEITDSRAIVDEVKKYDLSKSSDAREFQEKWAAKMRDTFPFAIRVNPNGTDTHHLTFRNMHIHNVLNMGWSIQSNTRYVTIENSYIHDLGYPRSGYGVYTHNKYFTFRNNILHSMTYGLHLYGTAYTMTDVLIENNLFFDIANKHYWHMSSKKVKTGGRAILMDGPGSDVIIRNNVIHSSRNGIIVNTTDTLVEHNLIYDGTSAYGINTNSVQMINNIVHSMDSSDTVYGKYSPSVERGTSSAKVRLVDPKRVEKGITGGELIRDKGVNSSAKTDILGVTRPQGSAPDIGPFELK